MESVVHAVLDIKLSARIAPTPYCTVGREKRAVANVAVRHSSVANEADHPSFWVELAMGDVQRSARRPDRDIGFHPGHPGLVMVDAFQPEALESQRGIGPD